MQVGYLVDQLERIPYLGSWIASSVTVQARRLVISLLHDERLQFGGYSVGRSLQGMHSGLKFIQLLGSW